MGERLNIEIINKKNKDGSDVLASDVLANAYFHWSGYTESAIELVADCLEAINSGKYDNENKKVMAAKIFEVLGSGLNGDERARATSEFADFNEWQLNPCMTRNEGLTSITEVGIAETRYWENERVTISVEEQMIYFNACHEMSFDEYDEYKNDKDPSFEEMQEMSFDITFNEYADFTKRVLKLFDDGIYVVKSGNKIMSFIA